MKGLVIITIILNCSLKQEKIDLVRDLDLPKIDYLPCFQRAKVVFCNDAYVNIFNVKYDQKGWRVIINSSKHSLFFFFFIKTQWK